MDMDTKKLKDIRDELLKINMDIMIAQNDDLLSSEETKKLNSHLNNDIGFINNKIKILDIDNSLLALAKEMKDSDASINNESNLSGYTIVALPVKKTVSYYSFSIGLACNRYDCKVILFIYKDWQFMEATHIYHEDKLSMASMELIIDSIVSDNYSLDRLNSHIDKVLETINMDLINDDLVALLISARMGIAINNYVTDVITEAISKQRNTK